jgi:hypothetical protein
MTLTRLSWGLLAAATLAAGCRPARVVVVEAAASAETATPGPSSASAAVALATPAVGQPFAFPTDAAGVILARTLPPPELPTLPPGTTAAPVARPGLTSLERPETPLPATAGGPVPAPVPVPRAAAPRELPPAPPLEDVQGTPAAPDRATLPTAALPRHAARDVEKPVPPSVLGKGVPDRALSDDPTAAHSAAAAVAAPPPAKGPAPFVRSSLPDPFENADAVKLPPGAVPADDPTVGLPQTPAPPRP